MKRFLVLHLAQALLAIFILEIAPAASTQNQTPLTLEEYKKVIPNLACSENHSDFPAEMVCVVESKHTFAPDEKVELYFSNGKNNIQILTGSQATLEKKINDDLQKVKSQVTMINKGNVTRWSGSKTTAYLVKSTSEKQWQLTLARSEIANQSLDLKYGFDNAPMPKDFQDNENIASATALTSPPIPDTKVANGTNAVDQHNTVVTTIFGISIGANFDFPECPKQKSVNGELLYSSELFPLKACFFRAGYAAIKNTPILNERVSLNFPLNEKPTFGISWNLLVVRGIVEGIEIATLGLKFQDVDLSDLKKKFGEPTTWIPSKFKNLMGAEFDTFTAIWKGNGFTVRYWSVASRADHGEISVYTKVGQEEDDRIRAELKKKRGGREL